MAIERGCAKFVEFRDRFLAERGTILCPELHKQVFGRSYVFTDPVQHEEFGKREDHNVKCAEIVASAVKVACEMLLDYEELYLGCNPVTTMGKLNMPTNWDLYISMSDKQ